MNIQNRMGSRDDDQWLEKIQATRSEHEFRETVFSMLEHSQDQKQIADSLDILIVELEADDEQLLIWMMEHLDDSKYQLPILNRLSSIAVADIHYETLRQFVHKYPDKILFVLNSSLSGTRCLELSLESLPILTHAVFGSVLAHLLQHATIENIQTLLETLRAEVSERPLSVHLSVSQTLLQSNFLNQYVEEVAKKPTPVISLDLLVLLQSPPSPRTDAIWDQWAGTNNSSIWERFQNLFCTTVQSELAPLLLGGGSRMAENLHRLAIFLLLAPARGTPVKAICVQEFVKRLYTVLGESQQSRLIQNLLQLSDELRGRNSLVRQIVGSVLMDLAGDGSLERFKKVFVQHFLDVGTAVGVDHDCDLLVNVVHNEDTLVDLVRTQIFESSSIVEPSRAIRGIALAAKVTSKADVVLEWVICILLPSTRRMVDPELGLAGLKFLESLGNQGSDVFPHIKMILTNTGLIQILEHYQQTKNESNVVLGYSNHYDGKASSRAMIICVDFYLRNSNVNTPERWRATLHFVFCLVDMYLNLGRLRNPSWKPDLWLTAAVEFPVIDIEIDKNISENRDFLELIQSNLGHFELARGIQNVYSKFQPVDHVLHKFKHKQLAGFMKSIEHWCLSLLVSVAVMNAVLKNSHEHFASKIDDKSDSDGDQTVGQLPLLQSQLVKLYDIRAKSKTAYELSSAVVSSLRRQRSKRKRLSSRSKEFSDRQLSEKLYTTFARACGDASSIANDLLTEAFDDPALIGTEVLLACLCDTDDDHALECCLKKLTEESWDGDVFTLKREFHIVNLRLQLIHQATIRAENENVLGQRHLASCIRFSCFLLDVLPGLRTGYFANRAAERESEECVSLSLVATLATSYLLLLSLSVHNSGSGNLGVDTWMSLCARTLRKDESHHANKSAATDGTKFETARKIFAFFSKQLMNADNSMVAGGLIDMLTAFSSKYAGVFDDIVIQLSWIALHTVYDCPSVVTKCPMKQCWFYRLLQTKCDLLGSEGFESVLQRLLRSYEDESMTSQQFRDAVVRHWGILMTMKVGHGYIEGHMSEIVQEVESVARFLVGHREETGNLGKKKLKLPSIPSLGGSGFVVAFETVLDLLVGSIAFLDPIVPETQRSPYRHVQILMGLFSRTVHLYMEYYDLFPRTSVVVFCGVYKTMIDVALIQLRRAVEWRHRQPLLSISERESGKHDSGALIHLQELIDSIACRVIGSALSLCTLWRTKVEPKTVCNASVSSLRLAAEKAGHRLNEYASSHNLFPLKFNKQTELFEIGIVESRTKGFHRQSTSGLLSQIEDVCMPSETTLMTHQKEDERIAAIDRFADDSDGSSTDSFGASGGWGSESDCDGTDSGLVLQSNASFSHKVFDSREQATGKGMDERSKD